MDEHAYYLIDLFQMIREEAAGADETVRAGSEPMEYFKGRRDAFIEVLSLMQSQANAFQLDLERLGLGNFNPFSDELRVKR